MLNSQHKSTGKMFKQKGLTLLEVIISLAIVSAATVGLSNIASRYSDDTLNSVTASQVRTFGLASNAYIKENYAAIQAVATPTAPALINVGTLIASGKLPAGYSAVDAKGQTLCALVIKPTANRLQAMVVAEGGTATNDLDLGALASTIGGAGGGVYSTANTAIRGSVGGWSVPAANFDNLINNLGVNCSGIAGNVRVVTGTPVMALWFENGDANAAFLSRDAVPNRPDLNTMNTPLLMNSVQTATTACSVVGAIARDAGGAVLTCQSGQWKPQGSAFWQDAVATFSALPVCTAASAGQTRLVMGPTVGVGPRAYACTGSAWSALAVDDQGNVGIPRKITADGSETSYGAMTIQGDKNGWSGIDFKTASGANAGTLMMHPSYSGFFSAADNAWRWYVDDSGNSIQPGQMRAAGIISEHYTITNGATITTGNTYGFSDTWSFLGYGAGGSSIPSPQSPAGSAYLNDAFFRSTGRWASQGSPGGVNYAARFVYNPGCGYGGACECPANTVMTGTWGWWASYTDAYYVCAPLN